MTFLCAPADRTVSFVKTVVEYILLKTSAWPPDTVLTTLDECTNFCESENALLYPPAMSQKSDRMFGGNSSIPPAAHELVREYRQQVLYNEILTVIHRRIHVDNSLDGGALATIIQHNEGMHISQVSHVRFFATVACFEVSVHIYILDWEQAYQEISFASNFPEH